jgi:hypothetical protein
MASLDIAACSTIRTTSLPSTGMRSGALRFVRAPGLRGCLSPEEAAYALAQRREQFRGELSRRSDGAAVASEVREQIVDDATAVVVMSCMPDRRRPDRQIRDEQHLVGAFWASAIFLLKEHRGGRHSVRWGSRHREPFEPATHDLSDGSEPFDVIESRERMVRAAEMLAALDDFERQVVTLMATQDLGSKRAAKALGVPTKTVVAAVRGAETKLERIAVIAAAGRMCEYRREAILAHLEGAARGQEEKAARAHLMACAGCEGLYKQMVHEMRGRAFKRCASAAFLPVPALPVGHGSWLERLAVLMSQRPMSGSTIGDRAVGVLGGGGLVAKTAVAGSAALVIAAGADVVGQHVSFSPPAHHHQLRRHAFARATKVPGAPTRLNYATTTIRPVIPSVVHRVEVPRRATAQPPSRDLGYLTLQQTSTHSADRVRAASLATHSTIAGSGAPSPHSSDRSGGGSSLNYLGR